MNGKSLERVVSQKAFQMGNSFPCQICVLGFFCGVCLTTLFLAAITTFAIGQTPFSYISMEFSTSNSSSRKLNVAISDAYESQTKEAGSKIKLLERNEKTKEEKESLLYSAWTTLLEEPTISDDSFLRKFGLSKSALPKAPHLETCKIRANTNEHLDNPILQPRKSPINDSSSTRDERLSYLAHQGLSRGFYPPWITGSDEENYHMTRKVQHDIWIHQRPLNCSDPDVKFLVVDWERPPGYGIGAQLAEMCSLLAIAINEKRVLVTNYYNRADHGGCKGSSRARWSCYFLPETSLECRDRAMDLLGRKEALDKGIVTSKESYSSKKIWTEPTPRIWGKPWSYLRPTTEINGILVLSHRKMDRRWWRAQGVRYLMRFQTEYTCDLLNSARHAAFGLEAANMVVATLQGKWPPQDNVTSPSSGIEESVWSNHKPWMPSPLLSMHVRMGDKACEMKVVQFENYMLLAERIRKRFPQLHSIWLSTEMQEVIEKTKEYQSWRFYYTNALRQVGNMTMAAYEASLGRETSTNNPLANFIMATESNFFVGALGSTWCFLIDGMRNTGGKVMAGYLSVNKDRFW